MNLIRLRWLLGIFSILLLLSFAFAEGTRTWEQSKFEELIKGTTKGVAVRSTGGLELAPAFTALSTTPSTYIWSIAADRDGNLYAASGSPARVYRITPDGKSTVIFEPQELQVQALVVNKSGIIFAATNPDGKVYKIEHRATSAEKGSSDKKSTEKSALDSGWSSSVYFEPGTKYIWDLAVDDSGNLYVATGDHGEIFRVTPKGDHSVFFKSDEAHIRVMAFDSKGNLIAGSDGSGLVYRISPGGEGFVLYSAPKKEITALAIDKTGNIYAAGVGEKRGSTTAPSFPSAPISIPSSPSASSAGSQGGIVISAAPASTPPPSMSFPIPGAGAAGGSEIYRIALDGSPSRVWSSREDIVYTLAFDQRGRLLAGTGNRGHVFAITGDD
jgi:ligand-binding sensor domain-containing protein